MSIITISRGTFSGGKTLAECLAASLGYRCVDRDVIVEKAAAYGVSQDDLRDALQKPPSLLERFRHKKYIYLTLIQAALIEEVRTGKAVYHGNAGHLLLKGGFHMLRVRIIAPMASRIRMAQERRRMSREEAIAYIHKMDQERKKWTQYLYGVDWTDPSLYDLVVNLEFMEISHACRTISRMVRERCFEFTPECQQVMDDLALASRVKVALALNDSTSHLGLDTEAVDGAVRVFGKLCRIDEIEEVRHIVKEVAGVVEAHVEELAPPRLVV